MLFDDYDTSCEALRTEPGALKVVNEPREWKSRGEQKVERLKNRVNPRWNRARTALRERPTWPVFFSSFLRSLTEEDVERQLFPVVLSPASPFRVGRRGRRGGGAGQGAGGWRAEAGLQRFVSRTEWAMCVRAGPRGLAVLSHEPQKNARIWDVCHQGAGCSGCKVTRAFPGLLQSFGTWGHSNPSCLYCERVRSRA